jgi:hypothetical protein
MDEESKLSPSTLAFAERRCAENRKRIEREEVYDYEVERSCKCRTITSLTTNPWVPAETCLDCGYTISKKKIKKSKRK